MSTKHESRTKPGAVVAAAIGLLLVLAALYVLSIGPACALMNHDLLGHEIFYAVYGPLIRLMEHCPPVEDAINSYTLLFP
jgi:hypothetical protein